MASNQETPIDRAKRVWQLDLSATKGPWQRQHGDAIVTAGGCRIADFYDRSEEGVASEVKAALNAQACAELRTLSVDLAEDVRALDAELSKVCAERDDLSAACYRLRIANGQQDTHIMLLEDTKSRLHEQVRTQHLELEALRAQVRYLGESRIEVNEKLTAAEQELDRIRERCLERSGIAKASDLQEPAAGGAPTITYNIDDGEHYCDRCHGFAQHCPELPIEQRLVLARKAVETARKVLEARKQETALYDHEEEMLENAELWLSEVEEEAKPGRKEETLAINAAACAAGNHDDYLCGPTRQMRCGNCGRHRPMQQAETFPAVHVPCNEHPKYGGPQ